MVLTYDIVEGHQSRYDRWSTCIAELGFPPGYTVIFSDIDGEMTELLSSDHESNSYSNVVFNDTFKYSNDDECTLTSNITFAFSKVSMALHRETIRCITMPNKNYVGGQPVQSNDEVIKVVPGVFTY